MYNYRQATPKQREAMLAARQKNDWPWHAPPHFGVDQNLYLLTAACYDHQPILSTESRRDECCVALQNLLAETGGELRAWVVLPNHYHLVAHVVLDAFSKQIGRWHNGKATQWNREDGTPGRKVWHRFADRRIRGDRHYFASLNYVHTNPTHHGLTADAKAWRWSSLAHYMQEVGRETLQKWWHEYPIDRYGEGWDPR